MAQGGKLLCFANIKNTTKKKVKKKELNKELPGSAQCLPQQQE